MDWIGENKNEGMRIFSYLHKRYRICELRRNLHLSYVKDEGWTRESMYEFHGCFLIFVNVVGGRVQSDKETKRKRDREMTQKKMKQRKIILDVCMCLCRSQYPKRKKKSMNTQQPKTKYTYTM
jgi:hypothetical protein